MLRAENCICGTTSTGTGTLALAACPAPPGGTDLFQAFNSQALGTAVAIPISYTIIEYTGTTFQTASKQEKGIGSLTLGANLAASTLARTTVQQTATSMETTATYDLTAPTAISISQAVNTLVFIGASAAELLGCSPYFESSLPASDGLGALPVNGGGAYTAGIPLTNGADHYHLFEWRVPMLAKKVAITVTTTRSGGTGALYGRLYAVGANTGVQARPTKLLYDFGTFVGATILNTVSDRATSATGSGFYMGAGEYFLNIFTTSSGGSGTAQVGNFPRPYNPGRLGYATGIGAALILRATSGSAVAGDPANITSIDIVGSAQIYCVFNSS